MKTLIQLLLLAGLAACASPYYPVYVSNAGDYYIAERDSSGPYYGAGSVMYEDIGVYPWWVSGYPPWVFAYYSPNFYPHYFSIWYPPGYHRYHGFYGGYYDYWCPPRRLRRHHDVVRDDVVPGSPVLPPEAYSRQPVTNPELWRSTDHVSANRDRINRRLIRQNAEFSSRSIPVYSRSSPPMTSAASSSSRSDGAGSSSGRSARVTRGSGRTGESRLIHKQ
jgi:hypothetical protein